MRRSLMPSSTQTQEPDGPSPAPAASAPEAMEGVRLLRHGIVNAVGRGLAGVIGIVTVPWMLYGLGAEMYGLWIVAMAVCELVGVDLGLGWAVAREVASAKGSDVATPFVTSAGNLQLILGVAGGAFVGLGGLMYLGAVEATPETLMVAPTLFVLVGIALAGELMIGYVAAILYGLRRFEMLNLFQTAFALLRATGILLLLALGHGVLPLAAWALGITWAAAGAGLIFVGRIVPEYRFRPGLPNWASIKTRIGFGLASQLTATGTALLWKPAPLVIGMLKGMDAIVPFHIGQRFPLAIYGIGWRVAEAAFPAASEHTNSLALTRQVLTVATRWALIAVLPFMLYIVVGAPDLLRLWVGHADPQAVAVLRITAGAVFGHMLGASALHMLWGRGRTFAILAMLGGMAAAILIVTWWLVPLYGVTGAAWGLFVPMLAGSLVFLKVAARECGLRFEEVLWAAIRGLFLPGLAAILTSGLLIATVRVSWLSVVIGCFVSVTAYALVLYRHGLTREECTLVRQTAVSVTMTLADFSRRGMRLLRSVADFAANLRYYVLDDTHTNKAHYEAVFRHANDPYGYVTNPTDGEARFQRVLSLLGTTSGNERFGEALEVGCAEAAFTEHLVPRCSKVLAVDISSVAIQRARTRRQWPPLVTFIERDFFRDSSLGTFDLVVVMGVLESFVKPSQLRLFRQKLVEALRPGGYLLVSTTRVGGDLEDAFWRQWLHRGRWLNRYVGEHPELRSLAEEIAEVAVHSVYRKCD